jgi:2-methylisocitrate lyase-like PEP mutase family enzyme
MIIPGCHDGFGARLVAQAGFKAASISGFAVSGALGLSDGHLSLHGPCSYHCS